MGDIYMTKETGAKIMRLMIGGMLAFLFLVGYILWQSYEGRNAIVHAERINCESAKKVQKEMAVTWRRQGEDALADKLEIRSKRDCNKAFPKAGFFP